MSTPLAPRGWYRDAPDATDLRWWDGERWTDQRAQPQAQPPRQRRRWVWWTIGAIALVFAAVAAFGLNVALDEADHYRQDFRTDQSDFPSGRFDGFATWYESDGLHVSVDQANIFGVTGAETIGDHLALSVAHDATWVTSAREAAIGPSCWSGENGYAMVVTDDGEAALIQLAGNLKDVDWLSSGVVESGWTTAWLELRCNAASGDVRLSGLVDGTVVVEASAAGAATFDATGIVFVATGDVPAEWVVTTFERDNPWDH